MPENQRSKTETTIDDKKVFLEGISVIIFSNYNYLKYNNKYYKQYSSLGTGSYQLIFAIFAYIL